MDVCENGQWKNKQNSRKFYGNRNHIKSQFMYRKTFIIVLMNDFLVFPAKLHCFCDIAGFAPEYRENLFIINILT